MSERLSPPVTMQIVDAAPEKCKDCDELWTKGGSLARQVLDRALTLEEAQEELRVDLADNCQGRKNEVNGWAGMKLVCGYGLQSAVATYRSKN